jgi:hypothetical protein
MNWERGWFSIALGRWGFVLNALPWLTLCGRVRRVGEGRYGVGWQVNVGRAKPWQRRDWRGW